ncbi:MAG: hypothetical protein JWL81_3419 [Verrucomicrobiales bacterium]|nr:hypothetical protein [Verrucomicrobiales bacterium]
MRLLDPYMPPAHQDPAWPIAVGVGALAISAYGVLMHIAAFQSHKFLAAASLTPDPAFSAALEKSQFITRINSSLVLLLSVLLIAGAIALLRRRRIARRLLLWWAVCRIILALAAAPFTVQASRALMSNIPPGAFGKLTSSAPTKLPTPPGPATTTPPPAASGPPAPASAAPAFSPADFMGAFQMVGVVTGVLGTCALPIALMLWLNRRQTRISLAEWQRETS